MVFCLYFPIPSSISSCCADLLSKNSTQYTLEFCLWSHKMLTAISNSVQLGIFYFPVFLSKSRSNFTFSVYFRATILFKHMCCNVSTLLELLKNIRTRANNYVQCRQLSIVLVFDSEIPVCFYQTHPTSLHFSSVKSNGRDRPVGGDIQQLSVFWTLCLKGITLYLFGIVKLISLVALLVQCLFLHRKSLPSVSFFKKFVFLHYISGEVEGEIFFFTFFSLA